MFYSIFSFVLFNSLHFLVFFPVVTVVYYAVPHRLRWILLLIASYYFYMAWHPAFAILILFSTIVDYLVALRIYNSNGFTKNFWLFLSLFVNLGLLFSFKYLMFFSEALLQFFELMRLDIHFSVFHILLPVGISFYTFQTLSYTIDVYMKKREPETHFGFFALYVSFFPQLVAGPIERSTNLLPQLKTVQHWDSSRVRAGLWLIVWGFFMKMVIADRAGVYVDAVYGNVDIYQGLPLLLATFLFAFQIYGDFAGYSHIAIGSAQVLGIDIMQNFSRPYFATSVSDFWRRWHISLTTWFRDYVYIPIGGNRRGILLQIRNILFVFALSGLWHGAAWTFIVWGLLHGAFMSLEAMYHFFFPKAVIISKLISTILGWALTFSFICLSWVFFRADSITDAMNIFRNIFISIPSQLSDYSSLLAVLQSPGVSLFTLLLTILLLLFFISLQFLFGEEDIRKPFAGMNPVLRSAVLYILIFVILFFGRFDQRAFIYFQF